MDEGTLGLVLGLCVACVATVLYMIEKNSRRIERQIDDAVKKLDAKAGHDFPSLEDLKDEMADLIQDTVGSMRTPQIADHLGAILQQWAQIKFAKEMQAMNVMLPTGGDEILPGEET